MDEYMTMDELLALYPDEWVYLDPFQADAECRELRGGRVVFHNADRAAIEEQIRGTSGQGTLFLLRSRPYISGLVLRQATPSSNGAAGVKKARDSAGSR
jgi:hypothetical protein